MYGYNSLNFLSIMGSNLFLICLNWLNVVLGVMRILSSSDTSQNVRPKKRWWLLGAIVLMGAVFIQMPALWLLNQFAPNSPYIQQVSGNVWRGSAVVQLAAPSSAALNSPLLAAVAWRWRPSALLLGKMAADIELTSGQTRLQGQVKRGLTQWQLDDLSGKVDKQSLATLVDWQLPDTAIQVNGLSATLKEGVGFQKVTGQLTWVGGELGYPSGGKVYSILLPPLRADLSQESRNGAEVVHANVVDNNRKRLADLYLDNQGMLDVNLTQRLLENMPTYKGSAPADTAVISVRQPLFKGLGNAANGNASTGASHSSTSISPMPSRTPSLGAN